MADSYIGQLTWRCMAASKESRQSAAELRVSKYLWQSSKGEINEFGQSGGRTALAASLHPSRSLAISASARHQMREKEGYLGRKLRLANEQSEAKVVGIITIWLTSNLLVDFETALF